MKRYFFMGIILGATLLYLGWMAFCRIFLDFGDLTCGGCSDYTPTRSALSPDGKFTAYTYIESGGGAAGWCYNCVCIDDDEYFPYSDEYEVFSIVPAQTELHLEWIDTRTLKISYDVGDWTSTVRTQPQWIDGVTVIFNPTPR